jgi:hypothetical protein
LVLFPSPNRVNFAMLTTALATPDNYQSSLCPTPQVQGTRMPLSVLHLAQQLPAS